MILMTKELEINVKRIKKAHDKKYCFETYESILSSIFDFDCVSNLKFDKDTDSFHIGFNMKVCRGGDLLWILIKEYLSTILETEANVDIEITEREQKGIGVVYKMYRYTPLHQEIEN